MSCQEFVELVTDYLEGVLPLEDRRRIDEHLADCSYCTRYLEQMRVTIRTVGKLDVETISPHGRTELMQAFESWYAERRAP
jgi:predicted anti-sigma-YlaC factor YlaD